LTVLIQRIGQNFRTICAGGQNQGKSEKGKGKTAENPSLLGFASETRGQVNQIRRGDISFEFLVFSFELGGKSIKTVGSCEQKSKI
jgi:hypothetical protein